MARWKLSRVSHGDEEFTFVEGEEVTLGRGVNNTISLSSIVVSRNHCVINVQAEKVLITDLKSSNGIYVGLKKITPNTPYPLKESDIIGIGWTKGAPVANIKDHEKFMFKLSKEKPPSITSRIIYQSDNELCDLEAEVAAIKEIATTEKSLHSKSPNTRSLKTQSPVFSIKLPTKRKIEEMIPNIKQETKSSKEFLINDEVISILSDSDNEGLTKHEIASKKPKLELICEEIPSIKEEHIKTEREELEYEAFKVKQEYQGYDDEPIQIDSDSDDDESVQWLIRLSQSSPGKPFTKISRESKIENDESSYSQIEDFEDNEEEFLDDLISIPPEPPEDCQRQSTETKSQEKSPEHKSDYSGGNTYLIPIPPDPPGDCQRQNTETKSKKKIREHKSDYLDSKTSLIPIPPEPPEDCQRQSTETKSQEKSPEHKSDYSGGNTYLIPIPPDPPGDCQRQNTETKSKKKIREHKSDYLDSKTSLIPIPPEPPKDCQRQSTETKSKENSPEHKSDYSDGKTSFKDFISFETALPSLRKDDSEASGDVVDGGTTNIASKKLQTLIKDISEPPSEKVKKSLMIKAQVPKIKANDGKTRSSFKPNKEKKQTKEKKQQTKNQITNSQKEERKKKLKEIATKEKEEKNKKSGKNSPNTSKEKSIVNVKVTNSNRGAFLTDTVQGVEQPMKGKESPKTSSKNKQTNEQMSPKDTSETKIPEQLDDTENKKKQSEKSKNDDHKSSRHGEKDLSKTKSTHGKSKKSPKVAESKVPLKSLKPLSGSEESISGKPFSKVEPLPPKKTKKKVRFSDQPPAVHVFEIEEGNKMKKTSLVKTTLVDVRQTPVFSLEKITLMKILRWNPHWLEEQMNNNDPPPILGHNNPPMTIFHSFNDHNQYVQLVGDLLLMEIWECLTQGYTRMCGQVNGIEMRIASLPPVPTQDRCFELFNVSVNLSVPSSEIKTVPRVGQVMLVAFGPENARNKRFFYVHNVRCLPSPPNNIHSFFCISLDTCYTDKMKSLKPGELMIGLSLAHIQKELMLFEAMEYLAGSPLSEAILRPEPHHFINNEVNPTNNLQSQWTKILNPSQQAAVNSSVLAALGDRPCIQMVQGPPGTGKSSVICAIVMTYFYDIHGRKQQNRGKILICATSNAAVDELVIRLLDIRQKLPKSERFRMVRVGRAEAMHPRAHDISSQQLAQRDAAARHAAEPTHAGLGQEISHLEAKVNMWKTQEQDAKDPVRAAYCKGRVSQLLSRIALLRGGGGGGGATGESVSAQVPAAERRIIEGADIVVTTLTSAHNHKMRGLKRRIALCIVDEAGQAIEPETLIPLTLDVTRLTLIGDPQQLPGFICSQRAKQHGLGESLFSRLAGCAEGWPQSPVVLLNRQYRMQADIADYPNRAFYAGLVQNTPPPRPSLPISPYTIVSISSGDKGQGLSGANEMEAWGVARLVLALCAEIRGHNLSLAVITPYNAHKDLIKKNLRLLQDPSEGSIEVNTVDSFQGQERDVVVVSIARSQGLGFLADAGRMNVMLTRARHALFVCLNPHAMLKNYQWRTLVEDAQTRNLYRILPNKFCQGPSAGVIQSSDLLKYIIYPKHNK